MSEAPIPGKRCSKCKRLQPLSRFVKDKNRKSGLYPQCTGCVKAYREGWVKRPSVVQRNREYQRENARRPERKQQIRDYQNGITASGMTRLKQMKLKYNYGLTEAQFISMLDGQDGKCATCLHPFAGVSGIQVDHCHDTGVVRGLLCAQCNRALGQVFESIPTLKRLIAYLERGK